MAKVLRMWHKNPTYLARLCNLKVLIRVSQRTCHFHESRGMICDSDRDHRWSLWLAGSVDIWLWLKDGSQKSHSAMLCCKQRAGESCPKIWTRTPRLAVEASTLVFRTCNSFPFSVFFHFCSFQICIFSLSLLERTIPIWWRSPWRAFVFSPLWAWLLVWTLLGKESRLSSIWVSALWRRDTRWSLNAILKAFPRNEQKSRCALFSVV